jgi:hypothetical protein
VANQQATSGCDCGIVDSAVRNARRGVHTHVPQYGARRRLHLPFRLGFTDAGFELACGSFCLHCSHAVASDARRRASRSGTGGGESQQGSRIYGCGPVVRADVLGWPGGSSACPVRDPIHVCRPQSKCQSLIGERAGWRRATCSDAAVPTCLTLVAVSRLGGTVTLAAAICA